MAKNTTQDIQAGAWVELTAADATTITVQVQGPYPVRLGVSATAAAPAGRYDGILFDIGGGIDAVKLAEFLPGAANAKRVFAFAEGGNSRVFVSHD